MSDLKEYLPKWQYPRFVLNKPLSSFEQLLSVLPPQYSYLLPKPLDSLMVLESSELKSYYPYKFNIDLSGKRKEWEGIAILPIFNTDLMCSRFSLLKNSIDKKDLMRNITDKVYYFVDGEMTEF